MIPNNKHIRAVSSRYELRQRDLLFANSRLPQWLILLAACVITIQVWSIAPPMLLISWITLVSLLSLLRTLLTARYFNNPSEQRLRPRWNVLFLICNTASGLSFGLVHVLLVPVDVFAIQASVYAVTAGVTLCVSIIYASRFGAFITFALSSWLPPIMFLFMQNDPTSPYWGLMGIVIFSAMLLAAAFINSSAKVSLASEIRNTALVQQLDDARQQADALNQQLTGEIQHRRDAEQQLRQSHEALEHRVAQRTAELQQTQTRLTLALEASALVLWDWDLRTDVVHHTHLEKIFGLSQTELQMKSDLTPRLHPDDVEHVRTALLDHFRNLTPYFVEYRVRHQDGRWIWIEDTGRAIQRDNTGRVLRMIGTRRDITARRQQHEQERLAATVFEATSDGIFILDSEHKILAVNQAFSVITGYSAADIIGASYPLSRSNQDTLNTYRKLQKTMQKHDRWEGEIIEERRSGERYPQWLQLTVVRDEAGKIARYVGFFSDQTVRQKTEAQLKYLTEYDPLTQLANRSQFTRKLSEMTSGGRKQDNKLALLHIDLDRFKHINDTLGHAQADILLRKVAARLQDLLPDAFLIARLSADEFVVALRESNRTTLADLAKRILSSLAKPISLDNNDLIISASIGISLYPEGAKNSLELINQANQAMQYAKYLGGNSFQFHSTGLPAQNTNRLHLENELRKAINEHELILHYQPKLRLDNQRIESAEALVRWNHPSRGLLLPGEFITIAEETGLILPLGEQVLQLACAQAAQWLRHGPTPIRVAVNMSVQQLRQANFASQVETLLEEHQLPGHLLELELTENILLESSETVESNIAALQQLGVGLSVDDFGTGYSSLAYLKRFPILCLKIDRSFITELADSSRDAAIVRAIVAMAHSMNLQVVAEGVEHESQLAFLKSQGCDEVQGYLISRPLAAEALTALLKSRLQEQT